MVKSGFTAGAAGMQVLGKSVKADFGLAIGPFRYIRSAGH